MTESKGGESAASLVDVWYNSHPHYAVIMNPDFKQFGILAIQYPNGDVDLGGIFYM